jgi:transposase
MNEDRIEMSQRERDRIKVLSLVSEGKRSQVEAARLLKLSPRQVRRLQRRLAKEGDRGIVHRLRGRPSNHQRPEALRQQAVEVFRKQMPDFGALLASEKLRERGLAVPAGTLRDWLRAEGLLVPKRRRDKHRQRRDRRPCLGELVQSDGSHHDWLEGRGPRMVLVSMIDDATSKLTSRFYRAETTEAYMDLLGRYIRRQGRMVAMYVDRDSIFRSEDHHPYDPRPTLTQFKRALNELRIDLILANSPEAKGRIERSHQTAQDRLVKELRLAGVSTIEQANDVLERTYLPWFNRHCTVRPASPNNAHRPLHPSMRLGGILSIQERRKVCNDYTIRLDNQLYQILPPAVPGLRGGWVIIEKRLDGTLHLRFKSQYLKYTLCGPAKSSGALPPNPRSLSLVRTPAEPTLKRKEEGQAAAAQPSAVRPAQGRSGRTPAEPCPPQGKATVTEPQAKRPAQRRKWMDNFRFSNRFPKSGHFYPPQTADSSIRA